MDVAIGVGHGAGFFIEAGGGKNHIGQSGGFGEEKILHDDECVLERCGIELGARSRIGADDQQCAEFAVRGGFEHLRQRFAGRGGKVGILSECAGRGDRNVAGQQIGEEAHIGCAARVGVVAEIGEANESIAALEAPGNEILDVLAAKLLAKDDDERFLGKKRLAEVGCAVIEKGGEILVAVGRKLLRGFGLAVELDGLGLAM